MKLIVALVGLGLLGVVIADNAFNKGDTQKVADVKYKDQEHYHHDGVDKDHKGYDGKDKDHEYKKDHDEGKDKHKMCPKTKAKIVKLEKEVKELKEKAKLVVILEKEIKELEELIKCKLTHLYYVCVKKRVYKILCNCR